MFILNMKGHPAPDFRYLFSLAAQSLSKQTQEALSPYSFEQESTNSVSPLPVLSPTDVALNATATLHPQAPNAVPLSSIPQRSYSELSPIPPIVIVQPQIQQPLASTHMPTHRRREITVGTHYFQCCKCHKKRAVPM